MSRSPLPEPRPWFARPGLRWGLVALVAVVALAVALWPRTDTAVERADGRADHGPHRTVAISAAHRAAARLLDCPTPTTTGAGPLHGISVGCLADGRRIDLAASTSGRPTLLNLWAYWCEPCARELPVLQEFAQRAGDRLTVLTVHSDPDESRALARLTDLGVRLPGVQDATARVRAAVHAPSVLPVSVLLRADGTVATVVVRPFVDVADIAAVVAEQLGVTV